MGTTNLDSLSLGSNLTVTGTQTNTGAITNSGAVTNSSTVSTAGAETYTAGTASGAVAIRFGATTTEGLEISVLDETVVISSATASTDLTSDIASGAVILSVQANLETVMTATTAVKVGIGPAADPDKYGKTSALTLDSKISTIPDWAVLTNGEDVRIQAVDTNGAAAGTLDNGTVRVRIVYAVLNDLDDA